MNIIRIWWLFNYFYTYIYNKKGESRLSSLFYITYILPYSTGQLDSFHFELQPLGALSPS